MMKFFTHCQGEHPVVVTPDDHGGVSDSAEVWSKIGFPGREVVSHGHDGFDDAGASAISFRTDSVTSQPNSQLPKEISQVGARDSKACLNDRLVSLART